MPGDDGRAPSPGSNSVTTFILSELIARLAVWSRVPPVFVGLAMADVGGRRWA
jgi:hypothetical protein